MLLPQLTYSFISLALENSFSPLHTVLCLHSYRRLHTASLDSPDLFLIHLVSVEGFFTFLSFDTTRLSPDYVLRSSFPMAM